VSDPSPKLIVSRKDTTMGFGLAMLTKAVMTKRVLGKLPKLSVIACQTCSTLAAIKVYKDHIEVVRCKC
jgi:hypothetical protein